MCRIVTDYLSAQAKVNWEKVFIKIITFEVEKYSYLSIE